MFRSCVTEKIELVFLGVAFTVSEIFAFIRTDMASSTSFSPFALFAVRIRQSTADAPAI